MNKTTIEWGDSTWNPVTGCLHDCEYCYARKIAHRFGRSDTNTDGILIPPSNVRRHEIEQPIIDEETGKIIPYPYEFDPTFHKYRLDEPQKWKTPRTIFVCSMADLFGKWVPDKWIEAVFEAREKAPQHRYLFLTKNVRRYIEYGVPFSKNVWYGTSVTNQNAMSDFNYLPVYAHTYISFEPLLEDLEPNKHSCMFLPQQVDWFIIGAETGNRKGKIIPKKEWIDDIVSYADKYKIPVFMKDSLIPIVGEENMRREFPW